MAWLSEIDVALFRWINHDWANRFLDGLMPLMSGKELLPIGLLMVAFLAWRMGRRGLAALFCLAIIVSLGEGLVLSPLKDWIGRDRPLYGLDDVRLLVGRSRSGSMPSAHAANWFCVTTVLALFWRPTLTLTLPLAVLVSLSRVYNGVHYPSDILVGALLGAAYGAGGVLSLEQGWIRITRRMFPKLHAWLPQFLPRQPPDGPDLTVEDEWSEVGLPAGALTQREDTVPENGADTPNPEISPPQPDSTQGQEPPERGG